MSRNCIYESVLFSYDKIFTKSNLSANYENKFMNCFLSSQMVYISVWLDICRCSLTGAETNIH